MRKGKASRVGYRLTKKTNAKDIKHIKDIKDIKAKKVKDKTQKPFRNARSSTGERAEMVKEVATRLLAEAKSSVVTRPMYDIITAGLEQRGAPCTYLQARCAWNGV